LNAHTQSLADPHSEHKYRPDIDGLRAIAVLLVIAFHAFPNRIKGGFIGVDIFFVISGYLITEIIFKQTQDRTFSLSAFYAKRIRRIFPALILVILATLVVGWFLFPVKEFKSLGLNVAGSAAFVQNLVLLNEVGYFDVAALKKPLLHLWSLGIEEQYYIFWPLILLFVHRFRLNVLTACALLSGLSFVVCIYYMRHNIDRGFYLPTSRAWELLAGSWLAILIAAYRQSTRMQQWMIRVKLVLHSAIYTAGEMPRKETLQNLGAGFAFLLIGYAAFRFTPSLRYPGYYALFPVVAAVLLIACSNATLNQKFLGSRPMVFVGLISYPLYLWHFPIFAYAHILLPEGVSRLNMALAILLSFGLAFLTYICVEKPLRFGAARRYAVLPSLLLMVGIFIAGAAIYRADGVPSRLPKALQGFLLTGEETSKFWRRGECLLLPDQGAEAFTQGCAGSGRKPLLFLWGDSYAAAQYPGLKHFGDLQGFEVAEFTSSACPPALGFVHADRAFCKGNNDFVLKRIKELRPELVILHSNWAYSPESIEKGLRETIKELNAASIKVVLLGPVPGWGGGSGDGLSANVIDYYYEHRFTLIPERTTYRLNNIGQDEQMRLLAEKVGARYVSAWNAMCDANGCLARIGEDGAKLTAFDGGHMTVEGSTYLANKVLPELLQGIK
jgi:peptidoglycan/LPS O-acetylase OafA/YrhL